MSRAVFLDRDGVLNRAYVRDGRPYPPATLAELEILPGVPEACSGLRDAGFLLIVVTNQPDLARGAADPDIVHAMNRVLQQTLGLDAVMVCPHDDADGCGCRKPRPGLLETAAVTHGIDLSRSFMVGDRWRDVEAGRRAGCRTVFIDRQYTERKPPAPDLTAASLAEAAGWIIRQTSQTGVAHVAQCQ